MNTDWISCTIKEFWGAIEAEGIPVTPVLWLQMYKEKAFVDQ